MNTPNQSIEQSFDVVWNKPKKGQSNIVVIRHKKTGELYISYEGGIPIKVRELLVYYTQFLDKVGDGFWATKYEENVIRRLKKRFREMELRANL